jgi:hypothetical protein
MGSSAPSMVDPWLFWPTYTRESSAAPPNVAIDSFKSMYDADESFLKVQGEKGANDFSS